MGHVANLFPLNINFYFQGTEDEHKPRESDPGGDGRTWLRISGGENLGETVEETKILNSSGD